MGILEEAFPQCIGKDGKAEITFIITKYDFYEGEETREFKGEEYKYWNQCPDFLYKEGLPLDYLWENGFYPDDYDDAMEVDRPIYLIELDSIITFKEPVGFNRNSEEEVLDLELFNETYETNFKTQEEAFYYCTSEDGLGLTVYPVYKGFVI